MPWVFIANLSLPVWINCLFSVAERQFITNNVIRDNKNKRFISFKLLTIKCDDVLFVVLFYNIAKLVYFTEFSKNVIYNYTIFRFGFL